MSYLEDMFGLKDKVVILTGGGGVIANAMAEAILRAQGKVVLWDISEQALADAKRKLSEATSADKQICCRVVNTFKEEDIAQAVAEAEQACGAPNVLINAAGGNRGKCVFTETCVEDFDSVIKLNLLAGLVVPTKVLAKYWIPKGIKGNIINLTSMASYVPLSGVWAYDAAKAGVLNLTMATAREFAPHGIRVNAIAPGFFIGKQNKALLIKDEQSGELTERGQKIIDRTPFGRFGDVQELAGAVLFLLSDKASGFVTGTSLPVDGGFLVDCV